MKPTLAELEAQRAQLRDKLTRLPSSVLREVARKITQEHEQKEAK